MVGRIRRLSAADAQSVLQSVGSGSRKSLWVGDDGVFVLSDQVEVLRRIGEMLEQLDSVGSSCWAVQLFVVSVSAQRERDLGLDAAPRVNLAAVLAGASGGLSTAATTGSSAAAALDVTLRAVSKNEAGRLLADPLILCVDGVESRIVRGRSIPIRTTTVSQTGGSSINQSQIQTVQAGLEIVCTVKELDDTQGRLSVTCALGDLDGFQEGLPIIREERIETQADVSTGGVYLLASLKREQQSKSVAKWLQTGMRSTDERSTLEVWARVIRIEGSTRGAEARSGGQPVGGTRERAEAESVKVETKQINGIASPVVPGLIQSDKLGPQMMP